MITAKNTLGRLALLWAVFTVFFVLCQLLIAKVVPDGFGLAVLAVGAVPVAALLNWRWQRARRQEN
ncbi:MAG: hypothetical protein JWR88_1516 [Pseudonocardia sp.]|jgi:membrane protein implicated in regulation of membrane protease activity|nr:hypothetical protein [Pseudonocardia sp.]